MPLLRIERVRVRDLAAFATEAATAPAYADLLPLTSPRAASMAVNPCASPDDVALLVALEAGRCVGYQGLLSGRLQSEDGVSPVHWLVTFFVAADRRGRGIGGRLIREALALGLDLAAVGPTRAADAAYRACGFATLGEWRFRRVSLERLPRALHGLIHAAVGAGRRGPPAVPTGRIRPGVERWPAGMPCFLRDPDTVNWMLAHPWVMSRAEAPPQTRPYHFSHARDLFRLEAWEPPLGDGRRAAVVLSAGRHRSTGRVRLLDLFLPEGDAGAAVAIALRRARDVRAERIDLPPEVDRVLAGRALLRAMTRRKTRTTVYHPTGPDSPLARAAGSIRLDACDGDAAFS